MLSLPEFDKLADAIKSASASMEAKCLDIGDQLGTAVETIGTLTQTFGLLADELKGQTLRSATNQLSQVMSSVTALAHAGDGERDALVQLADLTTRIQQRIVRADKAVKGIGVLAINFRIEAVSIDDTGLDFASFTTEIGRTLRLAQDSLGQFTSELGGVGTNLRAAAASQLALAQRQSAAIASITARLAASVDAIAGRAKHAVAAAVSVAHKSQQVGQRISAAVMALQIGDSTRQRLEHIEFAVRLAAEILAPTPHATKSEQSEWAGLTEAQRQGLARLCCRLQAAQLLDAADEFDHDMGKILSSLQELATDAQEILRLGNATVGASGDDRGTFLGEVKGQVAEVSDVLAGLETARGEAHRAAVTVTEATTRLVSHTSTLTSLEEDIRIMGLNTTLKSGRLGPVGRPLVIIAQELRAYANQIATEASAVTISLDSIVAIAGSFLNNDQDSRASDLAAVADDTAQSVSRLEAAGQALAGALATLAHDTESVAFLLRGTVSRTKVHQELSETLRQAATRLAGGTVNAGDPHEVAIPEADRMLDLFMRSYTMDRERKIHDRHSGGRPSALAAAASVPAQTKPAAADLEDIFF